MPVNVQWFEPDRVLVYEFNGRITLGDLETLYRLEAPFYDSLEPGACLAVLLDLTHLYSVPAELFAPLQQSRMVNDPRVRVAGVAGANSYLRALATSLGLIAAKRTGFAFYQTRAEALRQLGGQPTLPVTEAI
ncbi:MAG: hypothetical protein AAGU78_16260 [Chloroflexota bacterium]|nr:hypothetical protein [Anaerolineae bacterium]HMM28876.1 hypothetical protein [Aggregatilineaceae bacterium]